MEKWLKTKCPVSPDLPLNSIDLQFIVQLREGTDYIRKIQGQSSKSLDELMQDVAADLVKYADDILKGDFEVFSEVDSIAKKRRLEWQNS